MNIAQVQLCTLESQVLPAIRGAQLTGYIDCTKPAPPTEIDGKVDGKLAKVSHRHSTSSRASALDPQRLHKQEAELGLELELGFVVPS